MEFKAKNDFILGLLSFFALFLFLPSCKKNPESLSITGQVYSKYHNAPISGVDVVLGAKKLDGSVYSAGYVTIDQVKTGSDGKFEIKFDKEKVEEYRLNFSKNNYHLYSFYISRIEMESGDFRDKIHYLYEKSNLTFNIRNATPYDEYDNLYFKYTSTNLSEYNTCGEQIMNLPGYNVDTTFECSSAAGEFIYIEYVVFKANESNACKDTLECVPGLNEYTIAY